MAKIIKCPNCEEESDYINYEIKTTGWESGYLTMTDNESQGDMEQDDSESDWDGDPTFKCRSCGYEYNDWNDVRNNILQEEEDETIDFALGAQRLSQGGFLEEYRQTPNGRMWIQIGATSFQRPTPLQAQQEPIDPTSLDKPNAQAMGGYQRVPLIKNYFVTKENPIPYGAQCPKCSKIFEKDIDEVDVICPRCNKEFNIAETYKNA